MTMPHLDPTRSYRKQCRPRAGETGFQVVVEQTDLYVVAASDLSEATRKVVRGLRAQLKGYMALVPAFATSLSPLAVPERAPDLIQEMAEAGRLCNVGPMAAVAGTIAQHTAQALTAHSPDVLVENGGDLYLISRSERLLGLLPDPGSDAVLGLRLPALGFPLAVCSSSSTIGHSLSLGHGDLVAVLGGSGAITDAAATALCNRLKRREDLPKVMDAAQRLAGACPEGAIRGVLAQCGGRMAAWGDVELTSL